MELKRRAAGWATLVATAPLVLVGGCTSDGLRKVGKPAPPSLVITPNANAKDVPTSAEIGTKVTGGKITSVSVADDKGGTVQGALRPDGSSWLPDRALKNKQTYTAKVTATSDKGKSTTQTTTFTTMAKPEKRITSNLYFENGRTYGVAMPVTLAFEPGIPKEARADVQKRLFVHTDPPQPGAWHWIADGTQVYYRAPDFWRPNTKISVRAALEGLPVGKGFYGDVDRTASAKVGNKVTLEIDNATKQMSVFRDDKLDRKIPVSLGKPSTPTSSGKMVIMEKFASTIFDTRGDPNGGYVVQVANAQRLTWGGEFIHAAPWSVGDQGYSNVSHGCTNVSDEAASWLMDITHVGDLVTVKGTEVKLDPGNGWTAWDMSWDEFVKGSALPVPADLKPAPSAVPGSSNPPASGGAPVTAPSNRGG
ncbi:Ig-like domain-containing protein [Micromonospora sp. NPDC049559]|uniref:L,D-transpeptidase n=1 Tax=Micromonospora sp. NPDC049559 TaxID=3155923 RepID=UPI0034427D31